MTCSPPDDSPKVKGRVKNFVRRDRGRGRLKIVTYAVTPEMKLASDEKKAKAFAVPSKRTPPLMADGQPISHWHDSRDRRSRQARGYILAIHEATGEDPPEIMRRLGLTEEEISHIGAFTRTVVWS
jgi:hypothetical protein